MEKQNIRIKLRAYDNKVLDQSTEEIVNTVKRTGANKSDKTIKLLGLNFKEFKEYFEKLFKKGMNWENHGEWHIDHIIPCAKFDLTNPKQQKVCFNYKNLQPLWAEENLKKSDKTDYIINELNN